MRTIVILLLAAATACEPDATRFEAEAAARAWLAAMNLPADGVACAGYASPYINSDNGWNACTLRFGGTTAILWCKKSGCKTDAGFVLPPAASTMTESKGPR